MAETCETCRFWRVSQNQINDGHLRGWCVRNAPAPHPESAGFWEWPSTYDNAWCGEYRPRATEPEKPKAREPGWYWVKLVGIPGWRVAQWTPERLFYPASTGTAYEEHELLEIGPRLDPPA